jgi:hypothetical protein
VIGAAILALALGAALAVGIGGASGAAASNELQVSRDGVHYSPALDGELFDGANSLVPGHEVTASLWIKNPSSESTGLRVSVHDVTWSSGALARALTLTASVGTAQSSDPVGPVVLQRCAVIASVQTVPAGASVRIDLRLAMADLTETAAQSDHVAFDFLVAMKGQSGGPFGPSPCADDGVMVGSTSYRTLAYTGGTLPVPLIVGGGLILGVGIFLVARRRNGSDRD